MLLLEAGNIKKYYADRLVIELEEIKLYTGDRVGVVGLNGSGKTTLLEILAGRLEPDKGFVKHFCDAGYIRQFSEEDETAEGAAALSGSAVDIEGVHLHGGKTEPSQRLLKEFELAGKLGRETLSGGEKTRFKIAGTFSSEHMLLFADEPTSNLDYKGVGLLKEKLQKLESFILISHDRSLLDDLCNKILEIRDGKIRIFNGNFSFYRQQCEKERERETLEYEKYTDTKEKLEEAIAGRQYRAKTMSKAPKRMGNSEARLHRRSANEKREKLNNAANSLMTRIEKLEVREKPREVPGIKLDFSLTNPPENKVVISAEKLDFSYDRVKIFGDAAFTVYNAKKTALWGENGTGKTTLLNLIHKGENKSIHMVPKVRLAYFRQGFEHLNPDKSVLENVMRDSVQTETTARTILARLLIQGDAVYKKVGVLSGGEKIKTAFAKMFVSGANTLLLDEPTNYLDMQSIEALEAVLRDYEGTVLFVSHDRTFVNAVADRLLILADYSIQAFDGKLSEYEERRKNPSRKPSVGAGRIPAELERSILQMRMAEVITRLSTAREDKDALEAEYQRLVQLLRN